MRFKSHCSAHPLTAPSRTILSIPSHLFIDPSQTLFAIPTTSTASSALSQAFSSLHCPSQHFHRPLQYLSEHFTNFRFPSLPIVDPFKTSQFTTRSQPSLSSKRIRFPSQPFADHFQTLEPLSGHFDLPPKGLSRWASWSRVARTTDAAIKASNPLSNSLEESLIPLPRCWRYGPDAHLLASPCCLPLLPNWAASFHLITFLVVFLLFVCC